MPLLFLTVQDLLVYCFFQWNQEAITAERCIDRFQPVNMCQGSCVFTELLQSTQERSKDATLNTTKQLSLVDYLPVEPPLLVDYPIEAKLSFSATTPLLRDSGFATGIFEPPRGLF